MKSLYFSENDDKLNCRKHMLFYNLILYNLLNHIYHHENSPN